MTDAKFEIGDVGEAARVIQGEGNYLLDVRIENARDAEWLVGWLREQASSRVYHGPLLPRLEPLVLSNRADELRLIERFCEESDDSLLYVIGLAGMGKSTVARAAITLRGPATPAVWVTCEGLDADRLLAELDAGLKLDVHAVLADPKAGLPQKINSVLGTMAENSIVVLDGFEALLAADGAFAVQAVEDVVEALVRLDHPAKIIATSRTLPAGIGKGAPGIHVYDLRGLDAERAKQLFQARAERVAENGTPEAPVDVMTRLGGHPKLIELVASATAELPLEQIAKGVMTATDVGDFVVSQVLGQLDEPERAVLHASAVFRNAFPFEALAAVVEVLEPTVPLEQPVRRLVRRSIFETVTGSSLGYFVHPILREAGAAPRERQAQAHAAAAAWFLREPIDADDLSSWEPGLYHLRRAAEIQPAEEFLTPYAQFLDAYQQELTYAGWARRLADEYEHLIELLPGESELAFRAALGLGLALWQLEDYEQAAEIFTSLRGAIEDARNESEAGDELVTSLALVDLKLGDLSATRGRFVREQHGMEEAEPFIAAAEGFVSEAEELLQGSDDPDVQLWLAETRFEIARARDDDAEMLRLGQQYLDAARRARDADPTPATEDRVAEASFSLGLAELFAGQVEEGFQHVVEQLRIKLAIGKIPGVAAGLLNLGVLLGAFARAGGESGGSPEGGAFVLASWQISTEIGQSVLGWDEDGLVEQIAPALIDDESRQRGRAAIAGISEQLIPYWERGLDRLGASEQAAPARSD